MVHHFDHRFGTFEGQTESQANMNKLPELTPEDHADPYKVVLPRYWIPKHEVDERLEGRWDRKWLIGWRDITSSTNERTMISATIPLVGSGNSIFLLIPDKDVNIDQLTRLITCQHTYAMDYLFRLKVGGSHINYISIRQVPIINTMINYNISCLIHNSVLELIYNSNEMQSYASDCGYYGRPFVWNEDRRFLLRCELDAIYFQLYEIARDDVDYIMETFPIVRKKDEAKYGEYRTKRVILEVYDRIAESIRTGEPYQTLLDPPPADPSLAHPPKASDP